MAKILDCSLRDGGYSKNWNYNDDDVKSLIKFLIKNKVDFLEIGYRNFFDTEGKGIFYRCTTDIIEKFLPYKKNIHIGVMVDTKRYSEEDFKGRDEDNIDFIRVATRPEMIPMTLTIAENLSNKGYRVFIQLMDITNLNEQNYIDLYNWEHKDCIESLYFADSYGILTPEDVCAYYNKLKNLGYDKISFHAHNENGNALKNTLKAISLGAYCVDVTQDGKGRYGGNLVYRDLKKSLKRSFISQFFICLIKVYQFFSKMTPPVCRFYPTCSEYTKQAILKYGILKGLWLGLKRVSRCHPGNLGGYDPVP